MELTLMNKNKKIFDFVYDNQMHTVVKIENNYLENENYAPLGLIKNHQVDIFQLNRWWKNRQIPASRNGLKQVLYNSQIYDQDVFDLLDAKAFCLSLSDQYWVKEKNDDTKWDEIHFFEHEFSENIGKILFDGGETPLQLDLNTPDMTSNGNYEKRWKIINGERYLIKAGGKVFNQEPYNEIIATSLYRRILNEGEYVEYQLMNEGKRVVSLCKNFIDKNTELIPAWKVNEYLKYDENESKYEHYIRCLNELKVPHARMMVDKMIVCDYLIANKDRHYNNFGVIRNVETLEFECVAPLFDNGCLLWFDENDIYVGKIFLTKPFESYEKMQLGLVKDFSWLDTSRLDGFVNEVRDILNQNPLLSKERIEKICCEVNQRIDDLILTKKHTA